MLIRFFQKYTLDANKTETIPSEEKRDMRDQSFALPNPKAEENVEE
jgi:hypothetical protein